MPRVEGESLRAKLERQGPLAIGVALRITREVASALDFARREGIVHRVIKPENLLLPDGHAPVADFGIARGMRPHFVSLRADPRFKAMMQQ
jgi:eukaryotic-like serine/threonine-protein kinase